MLFSILVDDEGIIRDNYKIGLGLVGSNSKRDNKNYPFFLPIERDFDIIEVPKDIIFFLQAEIRENGCCWMVLNTDYVVGILRFNTVYPPVYTGKSLCSWAI